MLADITPALAQFGSFGRTVHKPAAFMAELIEFIKTELPRWRDRQTLTKDDGETVLTSRLCAHLNSAARHAAGWDILQFRTEEPDSHTGGRKIDLVPAACGATIVVNGRSYIDFDTLLPIECKRLPTPKDKDRDEREYVFNKHGSTGGIQRFKAGNHGGGHSLGAMIGYVQQGTRLEWNDQVARWIEGIVASGQKGWTKMDHLQLITDDNGAKLATLKSSHSREKGLAEIELRHLWVQMN